MQKKVVFLYLYGLHQLYHSAITAMELGELGKNEVLCLSCNDEHTRVLKKIKSYYPNSKTQILTLRQPFRYKYLNFKKKTYPSVNAMIKIAKKYLIDADYVLTTSHGTPKMFKKYNINKPKFIYQYHGCGDRKYGFDPNFKRFDFMLLPGVYHQDRLVEEKIIPKGNTAIVGWPKFDFSFKKMQSKTKFFDNDNPIVLYTPHWEPKLTSYKKYSKILLEFFKNNSQKYNFIFAPHLLIKHWRVHYNYETNFDEFISDNVIIDFGSDYSTDGTYLNVSDVYIGDVSSMVYEFIAMKNRPCVFLNANEIEWKNNTDYRFWQYGSVVEEPKEFESKLNEAFNNNDFLLFQKERIVEYLNITDVSSSKRAANVIDKLVESSK